MMWKLSAWWHLNSKNNWLMLSEHCIILIIPSCLLLHFQCVDSTCNMERKQYLYSVGWTQIFGLNKVRAFLPPHSQKWVRMVHPHEDISTLNYFLSTTKKVNMQSHLLLEKNRKTSLEIKVILTSVLRRNTTWR